MEQSSTPRSVYISIAMICISVLSFLTWLIYFRQQGADETTVDVSFLSTLNAVLNSLSACCLALGYLAIRKGERERHIMMMRGAFIFSVLFLISYLIYHSYHGDTPYHREGMIRYFYFFILITHIFLSAVVSPLVLSTLYFAVKGDFTRHKRIAKYTLPIWMYVSVTGVLVYLMLNHF